MAGEIIVDYDEDLVAVLSAVMMKHAAIYVTRHGSKPGVSDGVAALAITLTDFVAAVASTPERAKEYVDLALRSLPELLEANLERRGKLEAAVSPGRAVN